VGSLFAAFLGYNPMETLLGHETLAALPPHNSATITGREFFPELISEPFINGLRIAFSFSLVLYLLAAAASWSRGTQRFADEDEDGYVAEALEEALT
jgi:hypothetical protein